MPASAPSRQPASQPAPFFTHRGLLSVWRQLRDEVLDQHGRQAGDLVAVKEPHRPALARAGRRGREVHEAVGVAVDGAAARAGGDAAKAGGQGAVLLQEVGAAPAVELPLPAVVHLQVEPRRREAPRQRQQLGRAHAVCAVDVQRPRQALPPLHQLRKRRRQGLKVALLGVGRLPVAAHHHPVQLRRGEVAAHVGLHTQAPSPRRRRRHQRLPAGARVLSQHQHARACGAGAGGEGISFRAPQPRPAHSLHRTRARSGRGSAARSRSPPLEMPSFSMSSPTRRASSSSLPVLASSLAYPRGGGEGPGGGSAPRFRDDLHAARAAAACGLHPPQRGAAPPRPSHLPVLREHLPRGLHQLDAVVGGGVVRRRHADASHLLQLQRPGGHEDATPARGSPGQGPDSAGRRPGMGLWEGTHLKTVDASSDASALKPAVP